MLRRMASIALLALVSMACSATSGPGPSDGSTGSTPSPSSSTPTSDASASPAGSSVGGTGSLTAAFVDPIVADAAVRAGVPVDQVIVVSAEPVTWPDGGLGCPLPGMVYPQVIVDGYQVVVQVGQQTFDYRGRSAGSFRLCTTPT